MVVLSNNIPSFSFHLSRGLQSIDLAQHLHRYDSEAKISSEEEGEENDNHPPPKKRKVDKVDTSERVKKN